MNALRQYVYGPGRMQPDDAIERYKERRVRDAQAPIGATNFDDLAASDSDAEESDNDTVSFQPRRRRGPMSRFFDNDTLSGMGHCSDTILAGAGLTVASDNMQGDGFLSYPGEGLVKDGLSYVGNALNSI